MRGKCKLKPQWDIAYIYYNGQQQTKAVTTANAGKDVERLDLLYGQ